MGYSGTCGRLRPPLGRLLLSLGLASIVGCTFERRPNGVEEVAEESQATASLQADLIVDSVRTVHRVFHEAMEAGDLARALSFMTRDAVVLDRLVDLDPEESSRGEILLEVLRRTGEELHLEPLRTDVSLMEESALVVTRYRVLEREGDARGEPIGSAVETLVLVRAEEGWMIQHLHRSLGAGAVP